METFVLETKNLGISFGGLKAVQDVNLQVKKNQIYGLIGPNGAGKTTIFNMITGVYRPTSGAVFLNGEKLNGFSQEKINHKGVARTFQNIRLFNNMTVIRNVMVGLNNQPQYRCSLFESMFRLPRHFKTEREMRERAKEILRIFDLDEDRNNLAYKCLLLDEPAAGMNPNETEELMETIRSVRDTFDVTVLLIEHDMKFVSGLCDEITVLNFGTTLAHGTANEVLNDPEVVKAYIGN